MTKACCEVRKRVNSHKESLLHLLLMDGRMTPATHLQLGEGCTRLPKKTRRSPEPRECKMFPSKAPFLWRP